MMATRKPISIYPTLQCIYLLFYLSLVVALDESFYTTKASPLPECWMKETLIVSGHTIHDLTFRRRIDSQKLKQK